MKFIFRGHIVFEYLPNQEDITKSMFIELIEEVQKMK
jgi:hypothetical protein